ncbi:RNA 2',3'-cyclic phosphodiesterase [Brevundimonas sp. 2R-24]|uniref:RNA 2',3'-cyclic phosphodiesterase n=1 Tax=Peiella sedimenti TaxID=3061083 RepID=A0ABT8SQ99_9CAUL|nr:RNA 2',3'-cyclic phosphodiesterase [Caulobacteraceae bacterium XZ-24]
MRLFAAIAVPEDVADGLARRQSGLPGAKWRPREALHITLRFFGEATPRQADDLDAELSSIHRAPFELNLEGVGAFGDGHTERAVWAGVAPSEALEALHRKCETAARRAGLAAETRAYRPHVTLAYLKRPDPKRVAAWITGHNLLRSPPFRVDRFGLYSSWLSLNGSTYELEREYLL